MLVGTAGFAAAEVSLSGSASMGVARDAGGAFATYTEAGIAVSMSGETDGGLSFGASFDTSSGTGYDFADDDGFDGVDDSTGIFGNPEVFISGAFGKLSMKKDGYAEYVEDDVEAGDIKYEYSTGGASIGLIVDDAGEYSASLGYTADALSLGAAYDSDDGKAMGTASYTVGAITATVTLQNATAGANSVKVAYSQDGISASVKVADDDTWEISGGYSANSLSLGVATNDASEWEVTAGYDLGGGASLEGGVNYTKDAYAGVKFAF